MKQRKHHSHFLLNPRLVLAVTVFLLGGLLSNNLDSGRAASEIRNAAAPAATTHVVTNANDSGSGSLRQALLNANNGDTITFNLPAGPQTINLLSELPYITIDLTIVGPGADKLTVRRAAATDFRIFTIFMPGTSVTISGMTIRDGRVNGSGGGILSYGYLTLTNCVITNNEANQFGYGGGVALLFTYGTFTGCTVSDNFAGTNGGGVSHQGTNASETLTLINCTITGNQTGNQGKGGGIFTGGLANASKLQITNCTIADNTASQGGGILTEAGGEQFSSVTTMLRNTIIANNSVSNLYLSGFSNGSIISQGNNLASDNGNGFLNGPGDQLNGDPMLAALGNYGGSTPTRALLPGSPAINGGTNNTAPTSDQRGVARAGATDIGAYESRGFSLSIVSGNNQSAQLNANFASPLRVAVSNAFGEPIAGGKVTFLPPSIGATAGLAPNPVTIGANNQASATATALNQVGSYQVMATANGGNSVNFSLTNVAPCPTISISPTFPILPAGMVGQQYTHTFTQTGGAVAVIWSVSGTLPGNMTLNSLTGVLIGAPTQTGTFNFSVTATDVNGCQGSKAYILTINGGNNPAGMQFYPLAHPVRLLDTRVGFTGCDSPAAKIVGGTSRTQTAAGRTCDGLTIPASAAALVGNATSVQSGGGFFTLYPSDIANPNSANSNYAANQILNSLFTVRLGANDGAFKIFVSSDTDIVVDITGYYAPPSVTGLYFHPLPKPVRLLDTRQGASACFTPGAALQGNTDNSQIGTTTCDGVLIPAGAQALVGNATTVSPQANGFLTLYPADAARPLIASANFQPGVNLNSPFMVGLSPSGQFNIYVASTTDLVVDVTGYYSTQLNDSNGQGLLFNALSGPTRLLDTRAGMTGCFTPNAPMTGGTSYLQTVAGACSTVPAAAKAVVGNATTINEVANGYLTFWPSDANQPFIATSNYRMGITFNRHFTVGLGTDAAFKRYAASTTDLVVDLVGYFAP